MPPTKEKKSKDNFDTYIEADVPPSMPFPSLAVVITTKNDEYAVPVLNNHQRAYLHDVALRDVDLLTGNKKENAETNEKIKTAALKSKAFQHVPQEGDETEERDLPALISAWKENEQKKKAQRKAKKNGVAIDTSDASATAGDDATPQDEDSRTNLLRGYRIIGWEKAIQRVITNKRTAQTNQQRQPSSSSSNPPSRALTKLYRLAAYKGRDKFRDECHDRIFAHSQTIPGSSNPGGKFNKALAELWAKEDQAAWEAKVETGEENVNWAERQELVTEGFADMVETVNNSPQFRNFMAAMIMIWVDDDGKVSVECEGRPTGLEMSKTFDQQEPEVLKQLTNAFHRWAAKPLRDYIAARRPTASTPTQFFPLNASDLEKGIHLDDLKSTVLRFLGESYTAFGVEDIPWASIATDPAAYYDVTKFSHGFPVSGPAEWKHGAWYEVAFSLAEIAGVDTDSIFFRKPSPSVRGSSPLKETSQPPPSPSRERTPPPPPPRSRQASPLQPPPPSDDGSQQPPVTPSREGSPLQPPPPSNDGSQQPPVTPSREGSPLQPPPPSGDGSQQPPVTPSREGSPKPPPPSPPPSPPHPKTRRVPVVRTPTSPLKTRARAAKAEAKAAAEGKAETGRGKRQRGQKRKAPDQAEDENHNPKRVRKGRN
ncbi:acid protease [Favolaschia claudopus]|uniref:Acid protease n=1 Tax=Favolaschia claudopus TaxID=2862362 RepID=A0AAW0DBN6_9AGAR